MGCLFCDIASGKIPSRQVHDDSLCVAFEDIHPQAPTHLLVVPREHLATLGDADERHEAALGHVLRVAGDLARARGLASDGYRVVVNCGEGAGQSVFHLHVHLLGGRRFGWPPG
jgi:histidine triad (HIT) family protein